MTKLDLLNPRFKVIDDYPDSLFEIGDILEQQDGIFVGMRRNGEAGWPWIEAPNKYPNIFRALQWWEEREDNELPDFVKLNPEYTIGGEQVFKVLMKDENGIMIDDANCTTMSLKMYLPATKEQYELTKNGLLDGK